MQILKKILILMFMLIAFSLICMGIVHADVAEYPVYYNTNVTTKLENYQTLFDNVIEYIQLNASTLDSYNSNINLSDNENVVGFDLTYSNTLSSPLKVLVYYNVGNLTYHSGRYWYYGFNTSYARFTFNYDSNYNIVSVSYDTQVSEDFTIDPRDLSTTGSLYDNRYIDYRLGQNSNLTIANDTSTNATFVLGPVDNTYNWVYDDTISFYDFAKYVYGYVEPVAPKCDPSHFLGKFSNVSSFDVKVTSNTNSLKGVVDGAFDIITSSNMSSTDWDITYTSNDDEILHSGSINCIANRCVFRYTAGIEDDIDTDIILNYHFEPSSGVTMPTTIQIDTCYDSDFYINTTYTYVNDDSNSNGNVVVPSTDNFLQDGTLPNISGLSDTDIIPDGPVDSILLLPLNIMRSLFNTLNTSTCNPVVVPIPFTNGGTLSLPCISTIYVKIGTIQPMFTSFLNWFSAIASAFILYQYFMYLYKWVDDTLTFRENNHFGGY